MNKHSKLGPITDTDIKNKLKSLVDLNWTAKGAQFVAYCKGPETTKIVNELATAKIEYTFGTKDKTGLTPIQVRRNAVAAVIANNGKSY